MSAPQSVSVDRAACEGHALCLVYAPDVFTVDDEEKAVVTADPVPADRLAAVEDAIGQCPVQALTLGPA